MRAPQEVGRHAERLGEKAAAHPVIKKVARVGYAAKGAVYLLLGVFALRAAVEHAQPKEKEAALAELLRQPFGALLLAIVTFGLIAFALWRLVEAVAEPEHRGGGWKRWAFRIGHICSAIAYGSLGYTGMRMVLDGRGSGSDSGHQGAIARALEQPLGALAVGLIGAVVLGVGAWQIVRGVKGGFEKKWQGMSAQLQLRASALARFGTFAFGVVFAVMGIYLLRAALFQRASEAKGVGGALTALREQRFGTPLLAITALGLAAYGATMFVEARHRKL